MIEVMAFEMTAGADEAAFVECDGRLQTQFAYHQPGLLRRTVGRRDRSWIVIDLWQTDADADACARRWETDPLAQEWMSFVDRSTLRNSRWQNLD